MTLAEVELNPVELRIGGKNMLKHDVRFGSKTYKLMFHLLSKNSQKAFLKSAHKSLEVMQVNRYIEHAR